MSFQPVLPMGGYVGWRFLEKTQDKQEAQFANSPLGQRDEAYFRERIGDISSAEELVSDRRLLRVVLTSFGLEEDLPNHAFIQQILESSTLDTSSIANRLSDKHYLELTKAFRFGDIAPVDTGQSAFVEDMISRFRDRSFEKAVGEQNESMRLALALKRELSELAQKDVSENTQWFTVLGTPNLRHVFEQAFQLPASFGTLDLDRQVDVLKDRTEQLTGSDTLSQFTETEKLDTLIRRFFLSEQINEIQNSGTGNTALLLLQQGQASLKALIGNP